MKNIFYYLIFLFAFFSCKKKEAIKADNTNNSTKTYNFTKTIAVYDSTIGSQAPITNYNFKLTVLKNNTIFKTINSNGNKFYFENFNLGKYDVLIEDTQNNFTSFRDTLVIDSINNYLSYTDGYVSLIKYPQMTIKRHSVTTTTLNTFFYIYMKPQTVPKGYAVYYNKIKSLDASTYKRLNEFQSDESSSAVISLNGFPTEAYRINSFMKPCNGCADTIFTSIFRINETAFKQKFSFNSGDSVYFFVLPAVANYFWTSYQRAYTIPKNDQSYYGRNYTGIDFNNPYIIPYKIN